MTTTPVDTRSSARAVVGLTAREREVLAHVASGLSNAGISQRMYLSEKTVEVHIAAVFDKLGLYRHPTDNRRVLAVLAWWDIEPPR